MVDWSWDLLDGPERTTLRALSVFSGGCTLAAAEAVCGPDALDTVAQLVDKSLLVADHGRPGGARYRLLETIHEYAAERAHEHPAELAETAARHTAYYRDLAGTADPELRGADQLHWLEVLETELDNIRAALHRTLEVRAEADAIAIALSMGWFLWLRNYRDEADNWLTRITALHGDPPGDPGDPGDPLYWPRVNLRMLLFFVQADHASEEQWASEAAQATAALLASVYRRGGPHAARFPGLLWPFTVYVLGGNLRVRAETDLVVANCREYGGDWELAAALMFQIHVAVDSPGGLDLADTYWDELEVLDEQLGDRWMRAQVHSARGEIESARGEYESARAHLEAAMRLGRELGAVGESSFLLARMAELAYRGADTEGAAELLDQAEEAAVQHSVHDAHTYIRYLRAALLLDQGAVREARAMYELSAGHIADGTPPPMFRVMLLGLSARVIAAEGAPGPALAETARAARLSLTVGCTEQIVAAQLDTAAEILVALGDLRPAAVLTSAAQLVRGALPRTAPEQATAEAVRAAVEAGLPADAAARARAQGAALDAEAAVALLEGLVGGPAPDPSGDRVAERE